jgi:hypothetical protein
LAPETVRAAGGEDSVCGRPRRCAAMSVEDLKRDIEMAMAAQQWGLVTALSSKITALQEDSPTLSPASSGADMARQTSNQEHSATLRAREEKRLAEAEVAQLEGELSRTRQEYVAALRDGTPTPMSRHQLQQSLSRVFDDGEEAQREWNRLEPTISFDIAENVVGFDEDLALEPLQWGDDASRGLGSARKNVLDR